MNKSRYYNRKGERVSLEEYMELKRKESYYRVVKTILPNGKMVSTVWLGLDHSIGGGAPLIFETMVFSDGSDDEDVMRYSTLERAKRGHETMVRKHTGVVENQQGRINNQRYI